MSLETQLARERENNWHNAERIKQQRLEIGRLLKENARQAALLNWWRAGATTEQLKAEPK